MPPPQASLDRFVVLPGGIVMDKKKQLMWASTDNGHDITDRDAMAYCKNYREGGYSDWKLPYADDLETLFERTRKQPVKCGCFLAGMAAPIKLTCHRIWCNILVDISYDFVHSTGVFDFSTGGERPMLDRASRYCRVLPMREITPYEAIPPLKEKPVIKTPYLSKPVKRKLRYKALIMSDDEVRDMIRKHDFFCKKSRLNKEWGNESGSFKNDFTDNGDGTVTDHVTGLIWQQSGLDRGRNFSDAQAYVVNLNKRAYAGYAVWRLPTFEELASLLEKEKINDRHIHPIFDSKQEYCWGIDRKPRKGEFSSPVGIVNFGYGDLTWAGVGNSFHVRAVCSGVRKK